MQPDTSRILLFFIIAIVLSMFPQVHSAQAASVTDDEGRSVQFDRPFERIISLYPAHTENLIQMGLSEHLIGISTGDTVPPSIPPKKHYSYRDNAEKFLAASPDLILIRPMISRSQPELVRQLRQAGITIVSLQPTNIEQMFNYWLQLGLLAGREEAAKKMVNTFKSALVVIKQRVPQDPKLRPKVYFEAIHAKMKTFSPTAISVFALEAGGGINIARDAVARHESNIAPYGKERILALASEIDVFLSQVGRMNRVTLDQLYNEPGFQLISAIRNKAVFLIEEEIVSRPTMRLLQGIEYIQSLLYPANKGAQHKRAQHN